MWDLLRRSQGSTQSSGPRPHLACEWQTVGEPPKPDRFSFPCDSQMDVKVVAPAHPRDSTCGDPPCCLVASSRVPLLPFPASTSPLPSFSITPAAIIVKVVDLFFRKGVPSRANRHRACVTEDVEALEQVVEVDLEGHLGGWILLLVVVVDAARLMGFVLRKVELVRGEYVERDEGLC